MSKQHAASRRNHFTVAYRVLQAIKAGQDYATALRLVIEQDMGLGSEFLGGEWLA